MQGVDGMSETALIGGKTGAFLKRVSRKSVGAHRTLSFIMTLRLIDWPNY